MLRDKAGYNRKIYFSPDIAYTPDMSQGYIYKAEKCPICHKVSRAKIHQCFCIKAMVDKADYLV